jgi:predicted ATP-grasp superfamily ATP-dependent carboligase
VYDGLRLLNSAAWLPDTFFLITLYQQQNRTSGEQMINFIVVGNCKRVVSAVLQAIRSFTDAKTIVIGGSATRALRWSALCKRHIEIDLEGRDDDSFVDIVNCIAKTSPHMILIPADCDAIRLANRVRGKLAIRVTPIPELSTLNMFDDKWQFHQFCTRTGLPVPTTRYFASKSELDFNAIASDLGVPFVVKPLNCAGSLGVHVVTGAADFDASIAHNDDYNFGSLIAQRYIEGIDVDVSFLAIDGRVSALAVQQMRDARVVFLQNPRLEFLAAVLCRASSYHGVMHVDARVETATGKVYLIESNPRFWASLTASVWCGLNFVAESIVPAPKEGGMRELTAGFASTRHPLIRPSSWRRMLGDMGERGRLLRAMTFDPFALGEFARDLPMTCWRYASRRAHPFFKGRRQNAAVGDFSKEAA